MIISQTSFGMMSDWSIITNINSIIINGNKTNGKEWSSVNIFLVFGELFLEAEHKEKKGKQR